MNIKTSEEIQIMREGGQKLARVRDSLYDMVDKGVSAADIEKRAVELIQEEGAEASFKKVPDYHWATCVNVDDGVVHGIPHSEIVFRDGNVVSVDLGIYYKGFHTDTALTKQIGNNQETETFLQNGQESLKKAIAAAIVGNVVGDISHAMQSELVKHDLNPIKALTGHGVGKELHEDPMVPCYVSGTRDEKVKLVAGMTLAIEVMYTTGKGDIVLEDDGWTLSTKDGKISALFEETIVVTPDGPLILTAR
jgi:methionyl aminopeptidase